jgi:hypothetical protein
VLSLVATFWAADLLVADLGAFSIGLFFVLALIAVDVVLALRHHHYSCTQPDQAWKLIHEAKRARAGSDKEHAEERLAAEIEVQKAELALGRSKFRRLIFGSALCVLALLKILFFYSQHPDFDAFTLFVVVAYIVVAWIHLNYTGYYWAAVRAGWNYTRDKEDFAHSSKDVVVRDRGFIPIAVPHEHEKTVLDELNERRVLGTAGELNMPATHHKLVLKAADTAGSQHRLALKCTGFLYDNQIEYFTSKSTSPHYQRAVALAAMEAQLRMLRYPGAEPA